MKDFLELLNQTDGWRLFWYCIFIITVVEAICDAIISVYKLKAIEAATQINEKLKQSLLLKKDLSD